MYVLIPHMEWRCADVMQWMYPFLQPRVLSTPPPTAAAPPSIVLINRRIVEYEVHSEVLQQLPHLRAWQKSTPYLGRMRTRGGREEPSRAVSIAPSPLTPTPTAHVPSLRLALSVCTQLSHCRKERKSESVSAFLFVRHDEWEG
jgi:hypothetical protein